MADKPKIVRESDRKISDKSTRANRDIEIKNEFDVAEKSPDISPGSQSQTLRKRGKDLSAHSVKVTSLSAFIRRKTIFDSVVNTSNFNSAGMLAVVNGGVATVNSTITNSLGTLWLPVFEVSLFVDAISESNEWPNGSFFTGVDAVNSRDNYAVFEVIKHEGSTDSVIKHSMMVTNSSGATQNLGIRIGLRFIVGTAGDTLTSPVIDIDEA